MKKAFAIIMALVLVFSLSISAFAAGGAGEGSITISNATNEKVYKVYKIFDATYNGSDVSYTIDASNPFFEELFGSDDDNVNQTNDYFNYYASTGVVTRKAGKTDAELFAYLSGLVESATPTATDTASSSSLTFDNLDTGYYVIAREDGTANGVTITTTKPDAEVYDKNLLPGGDFSKTFVGMAGVVEDGTVEVGSAAVGDTISWSVTYTATNYDDGNKVVHYTIKDTLTPTGWAALNTSSIKVLVNGAEVTPEIVSANENGFEIKIPWMNGDEFKYPATSSVQVTYSAVVQDAAASAEGQDNKNTAELDWVTDKGDTPDDPEYSDETETEVFNLGFTKVDGTNPSKTLPGAVFALYKDVACTEAVYVKATSTEGVYIVDKDTTSSNEVLTPASGQVVIMGLNEGTYYLKETTAPDGYNKLVNPESVEVGKGGADTMTIGGTEYTLSNNELNIVNNQGVALPETGGKGTIMMITFGTMIAIGFAVLLITQKKMTIYND